MNCVELFHIYLMHLMCFKVFFRCCQYVDSVHVSVYSNLHTCVNHKAQNVQQVMLGAPLVQLD